MARPVILYLRCDSIGDHVLSACILQPLRQAFPDAQIIAITSERVASLYERCPFINELIALPLSRFNQALLQETARRLKAMNGDICLSPVYSRTELVDFLTFATQAKQRVGFAGDMLRVRPEHRDINNSRYTHLVPAPQRWKPELLRHADFLNGTGVPFDPATIKPTMWTGPADDEFAANIFRQTGFDPARTIALFAGAQLGVRKYRYYGQAISETCKKRDLKIIALGGADDCAVNLANLNDAGVPGINLSGKTTLCQAAALLRQCRLAFGAETGLAHIAAAMGTRQVILLGGGHFGRFMPYSPLTTVACLPLECFGCDWECRYNRVHCTWDVNPLVLKAAFNHALDQPADDASHIFCQNTNAWNSTKLSLTDPTTAPNWAWPAQLVEQVRTKLWMVDPAGNTAKK